MANVLKFDKDSAEQNLEAELEVEAMGIPEQEEFLTPEEQQQSLASGDEPGKRPEFGKPWYINQCSENVSVVNEFGGKFRVVNNIWTPIARALWKAYDELKQCNPSTILFVSIDEGKKKYRGRPVVMEVSVLSQQLSDLFKQMSGLNFSHVIRIYQDNADEKSRQQLLVHLYKQLRMIKEDGKLRDYDEKEFTEIQANLQKGWDSDGIIIPDLLDAGSWGEVHARKQGSLFDDRSGENLQAKDF